MLKSLLLLATLIQAITCQQPIATPVFTAGDTAYPNTPKAKTYFCIKIPSVLRTPKGDLIAFGEGRVGSCADVAPTDLIYRRSVDDGVSWSELGIFHSDENTGNGTIGNIAPVSVTSDGSIFAPFTRNNREVWYSRSNDDGNTWDEPIIMPTMRKDDWVWVSQCIYFKSGSHFLQLS